MRYLVLLSALLLGSFISAQTDAIDIKRKLDRLGVVGSVLYVAAHPDDENTRLISYFSNEKHYRTTYISLTRGDGGQNLLGKELREMLGVLRTQELLAARKIDGGEQTFSRANDFGYSKHPDETLKIWDSTQVMHDLILAIRKYRPDIIVNRFDHRSPGRTHGHHTSSAILSYDAFHKAADKDVFPEQLETFAPWQPKREFFNTSWWFYGSREKFAQADKTNLVNLDIGVYYPELGLSNTEIAAASRSMHKCQGFGNSGTRGKQIEYIELIKGDKIQNGQDPFEGINTTWTRLEGGDLIQSLVEKAIKNFDYQNPAETTPLLFSIREAIAQLEDPYWKEIKLKEVNQLIQDCLGLYVAVNSDREDYTIGDTMSVEIEVTNRSPKALRMLHLRLPWSSKEAIDTSLDANQRIFLSKKIVIQEDWRSTNHYWLNETPNYGSYVVADKKWIGLPETPTPLRVEVAFNMEGKALLASKPVEYKISDPIKAEIRRPIFIMPKAVVMDLPEGFLVSGSESKELRFRVKSFSPEFKGNVKIELPTGWISEPASIPLDLAKRGEEQFVVFRLSNKSTTSEKGKCHVVILDDKGSRYDRKLTEIDYDHIPKQRVLLAAQSEVVKLDIKKNTTHVGYIAGAGDDIPESLRKIGITVDELVEDQILSEDLSQYQAIILGIRILNTNERIGFLMPKLLEYVHSGGNLILQYNTRHALKTENFAPYDLKLSRDRVSDETAQMRILLPEHPVFHFPNELSEADFEGWVQERGLYFPDEWGKEYAAVLSCNDPGETPKDGSLLIAKYGKGNYVYSGLSWFRQLPVAVPGAYKMFVNLLGLPANE